MPKAINSGLITFAFLSYLVLIGIPGRIGGNTLPVLALVAALFFWFRLRRAADSLPIGAHCVGRDRSSGQARLGTRSAG